MQKQFNSMKSLSIVVPIYKDGDLAVPFCEELEKLHTGGLFKKHDADLLEVIFVSDGKEIDIPYLRDCTTRYPWVKFLALSRNFGQHIALTCGIDHAKGDLVAFTVAVPEIF
jgi:glycosyltransferase involved in cell wall biosynthesis